jgi:hypothetical protein
MSHARIAVYNLASGTAKEVGPCAGGDAARVPGPAWLQGLRARRDAGGHDPLRVSLWESAEQAEQADELEASWVRENRLESAQVRDSLFLENA